MFPKFDDLLLRLAAVCVACLLSGSVSALDVIVDYTYDTTNWYGAGNPAGVAAGNQARATLDAAADFYSRQLDDEFLLIEPQSNFVSSTFGGEIAWSWTQAFSHPSTGGSVSIENATIAENEYVIYAGARPIGGSSIGLGGPGGVGWAQSVITQGFTAEDIAQADQIRDAFFENVERRGRADGFSNWGGAITFDPNVNWHYDHLAAPSPGKNDLYSVALHELAHALGMGSSDEWSSLVSGGFFTGAESAMYHLGNVPLDPSGAHWAEGTESSIYNSTAPQEAAMDPTILVGTRKHLTWLDVAGLVDIGWSFVENPVDELFCDLDGDADCDHADLNMLYGTNPDLAAIDVWLDQASTANGLALKTGDVNLDGEINSTDLGLLLNNFSSADRLFGGGDLNADSIVNSSDLGLLLNNFGHKSVSSVVPEPELGNYFLLAAFLLCGRLRKIERSGRP